MSQLKNFVSGVGRLNRRQFVVMAIVTAFIIVVITLILSAILISYVWIEKAITPSIILDLVLEIFIWLPFALGYFIRRWHDFGVKTFISVWFVILFFILNLLPGIWDILWNNGIFLEWFNIIVFLVYIFYPGNKTSNIYGDIPFDSGKPSRIFRYMKTGSWENKLK